VHNGEEGRRKCAQRWEESEEYVHNGGKRARSMCTTVSGKKRSMCTTVGGKKRRVCTTVSGKRCTTGELW